MTTQHDDKKHQDVEGTKPKLIRGYPLYQALVSSNAPESNKADYSLDEQLYSTRLKQVPGTIPHFNPNFTLPELYG